MGLPNVFPTTWRDVKGVKLQSLSQLHLYPEASASSCEGLMVCSGFHGDGLGPVHYVLHYARAVPYSQIWGPILPCC